MALEHATVAVGNREECEVAVGRPTRSAPPMPARAGVEIAIVKQGSEGRPRKTRDEFVEFRPHTIDVVNGLGSGDGFGGALTHGLLEGWDLGRILAFANASRRDRRHPVRVLDRDADDDEIEQFIASNPAESTTHSTASQATASQPPRRTPRRRPMPELTTADFQRCATSAPHSPTSSSRRCTPVGSATCSPRTASCSSSPPTTPPAVPSPSATTPSAMADRYDLLERLVVALGRPVSTGCSEARHHRGPRAPRRARRQGRVGSMNRGGLRGATFEMDDRYNTAYSARAIKETGSTSRSCSSGSPSRTPAPHRPSRPPPGQ